MTQTDPHASKAALTSAENESIEGPARAFNLPGVIDGARPRLTQAGLTDRCEVIAGDFFEALPGGGDCLRALMDPARLGRSVGNPHPRQLPRAAMGEGGRLLAVEMVVPSGGEAPASPDLDRLVRASDLEMLMIVGGRERTAAEYRELYTNAGFHLTRIIALDALPWSLLEGV